MDGPPAPSDGPPRDEPRDPAGADENDGPPLEEIESVFSVSRAAERGDHLYYLGQPRVSGTVLEQELWPLFREAGYEVRLTTTDESAGPFDPAMPQYVLEAKPRSGRVDGIPWTNLLFFVLTVLSTLVVGTQWYYIPIEGPMSLLRAWPFTAAVLGVLAVHEAGHYVMIRYHDVDASLPYFIPFPSLIGTMGAVIRMRGRIPDRKALFDIGVAGPLAGLVATVVVTFVGLHLDPIAVPDSIANAEDATKIYFNYPPLFWIIGELSGQPLSYGPGKAVNPVVFGGWVGMFVTFLNLLPVGQFDGGHIVRAILGPSQERVAAAVPAALFTLSAYLFFLRDVTNAVFLWAFWGVLAVGLAYSGPATPILDEPVDRRRTAIGVLTLVLGLLCFHPVPFAIGT